MILKNVLNGNLQFSFKVRKNYISLSKRKNGTILYKIMKTINVANTTRVCSKKLVAYIDNLYKTIYESVVVINFRINH